jgi:hypothetical protein
MITVKSSARIGEIKKNVGCKLGIQPEFLTLCIGHIALKNDLTLSDYEIDNYQNIFLSTRALGGGDEEGENHFKKILGVDHALASIFKGSKNLINLCQTCKDFNVFINTDPILRQNLHLVVDQKINDPEKFSEISSTQRPYCNIRVKLSSISYNFYSLINHLQNSIQSLEFCQDIDLPAVNLSDIIDIIPGLKILNIKKCSMVTMNDVCFRHRPNFLKTCTIEDAEYLNILPDICCLSVKCESPQNTRSLQKFLKNSKSLISLNLRIEIFGSFPYVALGDVNFLLKTMKIQQFPQNSYHLNPYVVEFLAYHKKSLRELKILGYLWTYFNLAGMLNEMKQLENLEITGRLDGLTVWIGLNPLTKLQRLIFNIEGFTFHHVWEMFSNIKELSIKQYDLKMMSGITKNCKKLISLSLDTFQDSFCDLKFNQIEILNIRQAESTLSITKFIQQNATLKSIKIDSPNDLNLKKLVEVCTCCESLVVNGKFLVST